MQIYFRIGRDEGTQRSICGKDSGRYPAQHDRCKARTGGDPESGHGAGREAQDEVRPRYIRVDGKVSIRGS